MKEFLSNFVFSFLITSSIIFAVHSINECGAAFDSLEAEVAKTDALLAEYRQELDTLHYSMYQTHLPEEF